MKKTLSVSERYDQTVLVLQGGGALGAYQAGVYEALAGLGFMPNWITGISIGAINSALIAGNPPERRVARLREFWQLVSSAVSVPAPQAPDLLREAFNRFSASWAMLMGIPGFFEPRFPPPFAQPPGSPGAQSVYDTSDLRQTLETLVDFDLINTKKVRLALGAVDVELGDSTYFDNTKQRIGPEHVMASGALPPAFAPVEIEGRHYWDGGIVSNSPLQYVVADRPRRDSLVFQVDLFSARGPLPQDMSEVLQRHKDIMYSSRRRFNSAMIAELHRLQHALHSLLDKQPDTHDDDDIAFLRGLANPATLHIAHVIYRRRRYELQSMDYEFSRASVEEHWKAGFDDITNALTHGETLSGATAGEKTVFYDLTAQL
jgi:NTE family protein